MKTARHTIIRFSAILVILASFFLASCAESPQKIVTSETHAFALDTLVDIKVYYNADQTFDDQILSNSVALINTLEKHSVFTYSGYRSQSHQHGGRIGQCLGQSLNLYYH